MDYQQYKQRTERTEVIIDFQILPCAVNNHINGFLKHHHWCPFCNSLQNVFDMDICSYCRKRYCCNCGIKKGSLCCKCVKLGHSHGYKNKRIGPL